MSVHESPFSAAVRHLKEMFPDADVLFTSIPNHPQRSTQFVFELDFGQTDCVLETVTISARDTARAGDDRQLTVLIAKRVEAAVKGLMRQSGRFGV
jgi:hypothetical protein